VECVDGLISTLSMSLNINHKFVAQQILKRMPPHQTETEGTLFISQKIKQKFQD